jgi:2-oxo-4-hydroxy-4-carboxy-5-ureidoimidazoline decarboxylase
MMTMSQVLSDWNKLDSESAAAGVLPCCGSTRWARELAQARPIVNEVELLDRSDSI